MLELIIKGFLSAAGSLAASAIALYFLFKMFCADERIPVIAKLVNDLMTAFGEAARSIPNLITRLNAPSAEVPPNLADFLLQLFLPKGDRETIPGDLHEEFMASILPKFGARKARFWFWKQTISTIAYRNAACRWLLVGGGLLRFGEWVLQRISH
jgi:hypothetical protein